MKTGAGIRTITRCALSVAALSGCALIAPAGASALTYAPLDRPGPPLSVPTQKLAAALKCSANVSGASRAPVLLVQGTGVTADQNWSWNYEPAFDQNGTPWCSIDLPFQASGDVQTAGEYVVYAIRTMAARSRHKVSIIGQSQGGMVPRWALRFWPDTRALVEDQIGFAPSNHGTTKASPTCKDKDGCSPAGLQQSDRSNFIKALNSRAETFAGISYTEVYTHTDETVTPNADSTGSSSLHTGDGQITNVAIQDICPGAISEHLLIGTIDPVAYALAIDALTHPGPADPKRISPLVCTQSTMPGFDPIKAIAGLQGGAAVVLGSGQPTVAAEPALKCYVTASCAPAHVVPRLSITVSPTRVPPRTRATLHFRVTAVMRGARRAISGAAISFAGHRARTDSRGRAAVAVRFPDFARIKVRVTKRGLRAGSATIVVR